MKTTLSILCLSLLSGCSALGALGYGATDIVPTLKYCDDVTYVRKGNSMEVRAICKLPTG